MLGTDCASNWTAHCLSGCDLNTYTNPHTQHSNNVLVPRPTEAVGDFANGIIALGVVIGLLTAAGDAERKTSSTLYRPLTKLEIL